MTATVTQELDSMLQVHFTPAEIVALEYQVKGMDVHDRFDFMTWAIEQRIAEVRGIAVLHGIFSGRYKLAGINSDSAPMFASINADKRG